MNDTISRSNCDSFSVNDTISRSNCDLFMNDTLDLIADLFMNNTI